MRDDTRLRLQKILRWPEPEMRAWTARFLNKVHDDLHVLAVVAVGSSIRPNVPSDDIDLVVLCVDRDRFRYRAPIGIDCWNVARDSVDLRLTEGHPLLGWAVQLGVPLFDRAGTWQSIVESWRGRVPLPDPALARQRAAKKLTMLEYLEEVGDESAASEMSVSYVTLLARAALAEHGVFPNSRPELAEQLEGIGELDLAAQLRKALARRAENFRQAS